MKAEKDDSIRIAVCGYCFNRGKEVCLKDCAPEGLYRYLDPVALDGWDNPPQVPPMRTLLEYEPVTRLAFMTLMMHYLREEIMKTPRPKYR